MKLNKVLALALSGVMAVSMLAGCSGNSGNGGQEGEGEGEQGNTNVVVEAVMDAQKGNDVVVNFNYSTDLETKLGNAIVMAGVNAKENAVEDQLANILGKGDVYYSAMFGNVNNKSTEVGTQTAVNVYKIDGNMIESAALKQAAKNVNDGLAQLTDQSDKYNDEHGNVDVLCNEYTYTGDTAMVTATTLNGDVIYYIAYVVTCTSTRTLVEA